MKINYNNWTKKELHKLETDYYVFDNMKKKIIVKIDQEKRPLSIGTAKDWGVDENAEFLKEDNLESTGFEVVMGKESGDFLTNRPGYEDFVEHHKEMPSGFYETDFEGMKFFIRLHHGQNMMEIGTKKDLKKIGIDVDKLLAGG